MFRRTVSLAVAALVAVVLAGATPAHAQYRGGWRVDGWRGGYWPGYYDGWYRGYRPGYYASFYRPGFYDYYGFNYVYPSYSYSYSVPSYTYVNPPYVAPSRYSETTPAYTYSAPATTGGMEEASAPPSIAPALNSVRMTVQVPENARLWIEDFESGQSGPIRKFESPATLEPGRTYVYTLKAAWMQDGQEVVRTKKVDVQPGREMFVDMTTP